jgi:hypothetical protein
MTRITANHKFLYAEVTRLYKTYTELSGEFINMREVAMKADLNNEEDWLLLTKWYNIGENLLGIKYSIVLNIAAYVEAMVNFLLSHLMNREQFEAVDQCNVFDKWSAILPLVQRGYEFPRGGVINESLVTLIKCRNSITHMKPEMSNGDTRIHKGLNPKELRFDQSDGVLIESWYKLPKMLIDDIEQQIGEVHIRSLKFFGGLERA